MAVKVLVVDDSERVRKTLATGLRAHGMAVETASDGAEALTMLNGLSFDIVVLDLMMPRVDGTQVLKALKGRAEKPRILVLSARDQVQDRVDALNLGADDYLVKPFEVRELEARISTLLRRHRRAVAREVLTVGDLTLDTGTLRVTRAGQTLTITPIGLKLLTVLMRASPRVVTRQQLEREVWGDLLPDSDTLRSHLYSLRKAIDKPFDRVLLHTLAGAGYRLSDDDGR